MHNIMTTRRCLEALNERSATVFLILFLCADFAFFGVHIIRYITTGYIGKFNLADDMGYPEMYQ